MKCKVEWEESATQEVAKEFVTGNDKVAIIDATHQIDRALESDPIGNGTPLDEGMFYIDRPPLRIARRQAILHAFVHATIRVSWFSGN